MEQKVNVRKRIHSENEDPNISENEISSGISDNDDDDEMNDGFHSHTKRQRLISSTEPCQRMSNKIRKPFYELIEGIFQKVKRTRLIIFIEEDKKLCYEFFWSQCSNRYFCCGCNNLGEKRVRAFIQNINTEKEYVKLFCNEHICTPREYATLKMNKKNIIRAPDFVIQTFIKYGVERKRLFLFDPQNRELGYEYILQKTTGNFLCYICNEKGQYVVAKYICDEKNGDYIELGETEHICNLRPYKSVNEQQDIILNSTDFTIYPNTNSQKLFVFESKENNLGYEFASTLLDKTYFKCLGCAAARKLVVSIHLCKNDDGGEMCLRMAPNQKHACELRKYLPEKWKEILIHPPNFIFYTKKLSKCVNLIIFDSKNEKQCYDFQYGGKNQFYCKGCRKRNLPNVSCTLCFDDEGKEYLKFKSHKHGCVPLKFSSLKASGIKIQEKSGLQMQQQKSVAEKKIIKDGNFELHFNRTGIPNAKLIVFFEGNKKLCYEYSYQKHKQKYVCIKCSNVSAKLCTQNDGNKFVELGDVEHKCEPVNYEKDMEIIQASSFVIHPSTKKHLVSKLVIFTNSKRTLCYIYYHNGQCKNYYCKACHIATKKKQVTAKLLKNEENEEYLLLSKVKHLCTPQLYDPKEFEELPKIPASRFEILRNSVSRSRVFVFNVKNPFLAHVFIPVGKSILCRGCQAAKKFTGAKVCTFSDGGNGEKCLELDESKHICTLENLLELEMIVKAEFFKQSIDPEGNQIIKTFQNKNKALCHTFSYDNELEVFQCLKCKEKDRILTAKICTRNDGIKYLLLYGKHICKPVPCIVKPNNTRSKKERKGVQLLTFDDNQKLNYSGFCQLFINTLSKYLTADPKIEDFKPISASFDSNFSKEKHILFAVSGTHKFALVFSSEAICTKIFDVMCDVKDSNNSQQLFKDEFLVPLFNEYRIPDIAKIINHLIHAYNDQERNETIKYLQENAIQRDMITKIFSEYSTNLKENADRSEREPEIQANSTTSYTDEDEAHYSISSNDSENDLSEDESNVSSLHRKQPRVTSKISKKIEKPDYEFIEGIIHGEKKTRLIIFESDKKFCYEFHWSTHDKAFHCCGCTSLRHRRVRAIIHNANTKDEYIVTHHAHVCQPREYANLKIFNKKQILYPPNFEVQTMIKDGNERKHLIVFEPTNRNLCYKYSVAKFPVFTCQKCAYQGLSVRAHLRIDSSGKEYVEIGNESHICELLEYVPVTVDNYVIIESTHFELYPQTKAKPKLFIFETLEKKKGHLFSQLKSNIYNCLSCSKIRGAGKDVTIELCQKEGNEEYFVKMKSSVKHKCKAREYQPQKWKEIFIYPPNFIFYKKETSKYPQLIIFCSEDKKQCYDYVFTGKNIMKCKGCKTKKHYQSVLILHGSEENEYLQLGINEHICEPVEYEDVEGTGLEILTSSGIKYQKEVTKKKIDENKIVKSGDFTILEENGIGTKKLFIFDKNDRTLCYKYSYQNKTKRFQCLKCHSMNLTVSAKLCTDEDNDGKQYLKLGENEHICQPIKYEPKNTSTRITDFIHFESNKKLKTPKLVIFASSNHSLCYVYSFCNYRKHFMCLECFTNKTRKCVSTKIYKDENGGQDFVLFNKCEHLCKPVKYDPTDFEEIPKIQSSRFELLHNLWGTPNSRLFIFNADNLNLGYEFSKATTFDCRGCLEHPDGKKYTKAKLISDDENGEFYVEMDETKHVCKIQDFNVLKRLFTSGEFEKSLNKKGKQMITTFHGKNMNLCYKFTYDDELQAFRCLQCKGKYVTAKLCKRNEEEEYVLLNYSHFCKPMARTFLPNNC